MYKLIYTRIDEGNEIRVVGHETETTLRRMIALANGEQEMYDGCHIEDEQGRAIWEPSLGRLLAPFQIVEVGQVVRWLEQEYRKIPVDNLPRYGWVNCIGPTFYEGDTGHRFIDRDTLVEIIP